MTKNYVKGAVLTLSGGCCWGISGTVGQYLFQYEGMDSRFLVPVRMAGAAIILLLFSLFYYGPELTFRPWKKKSDILGMFIYGLCGISLCQCMYFLTIQYSNAGFATIMQQLAPVIVMAVMCLLEKRAPRLRELACIILAIAGVILITTQGDFSTLSVPPVSIVTGLVSALCVTLYNMYSQRLLSRYPVALMQGWAFFMGCIFFTVIFRPWELACIPSFKGLLGILFVIFIGNVAAFTMFMSGVKYVGAQSAVLYGFSEPLVAAIMTIVFFNTPFTLAGGLGFILIFAMLLLLSSSGK